MATIFVRRTVAGFVALDDDDLPKAWKIGDVLRAEISKPRNIKFHRKAFALLKMVLPHTNYPSTDALRDALTVGAGFVETVINPMTGEVGWKPKSWAFSNMGEEEFSELYNRMIDVALKLVPGSSRPDWEEAVDNIVRM